MKISNVINGGDGMPQLNLTRAQIEQLTAEHDSVDDMIVALEAAALCIGSPLDC